MAGTKPERRAAPMVLRPFNLSRWFALIGLLSIASISAIAGYLISEFVTQRMVRQEGQLTLEMVENLVLTEKSMHALLVERVPVSVDEPGGAFAHLARMPGVLRSNLYDTSRRILWSSDADLIGQQFGANEELDEALSGKLVAHGKRHEVKEKAEHLHLARAANFFVEIYLPVRDTDGTVLGAIEFYKNPVALFNALQYLNRSIAVGATLAGLFLFVTLFGVVRRADLLISQQQGRLVDAETLAVVGEMSSAIAHGIRNPLASIRSSAELILVTDEETGREAAADIISESDRLEAWVRELLSYSRPLEEKAAAVSLRPILSRCVDEFGRELHRRRITASLQMPEQIPEVRGDPLLLAQVLHSVVANAIEAIQADGKLQIGCESLRGGRQVVLAVRDSGPGMTAEQLQRAGKPFYTTKTQGLGVGLALARRIVERYGGALEIDSAPGQGTAVRLVLACA
ncbi:two-component sensor histidine kinase [Aromatoleum toluvorans]|uniref:histidine kinase n=1 Tax=Aromatoleum toluvorans TaxID=92002 RepID=A0ABX1PSH6_9RHOO|nr:ATP-binding protein [Aromatoleum toluvorans]NMG42394.1 two-component sensor histidine kinase [Aromatoleum toluvorans]